MKNKMSNEGKRNAIHSLVDVVSEAYLTDLHWTVQQYAAKSLNEGMEEVKFRKVK